MRTEKAIEPKVGNKIKELKRALILGHKVTARMAIDKWGYYRLGAGIHTLRKQGWDIVTTMRTAYATNGTGALVQYAEYQLRRAQK